MPPKKAAAGGGGESKKAVQKKKAQLIEDKTFGLKNKNKSKKVQQQVKSIEKNVLNSGDPKLRKLEEERKAQRALAKAQRKAMEDERNALFGEALLAVQKKNKNTNMQEGKLEAKGRDGNDEADKKGTSRAMKMMYQMDAQEMAEKLREDPNYIPTIEDEIESERQKKVAELKASGKAGTPVTAETFAAWYHQKRQRKLEAAKLLVEAELKKKKGGKGLGVLSGRALFEYKRELFKDADAIDGEGDGGEERGEVFDLSKLAREQEEEDAANERNNNYNNHNSTDENENNNDDDNKYAENGDKAAESEKPAAAANLQSHLFLQGDDDDLDDLLEES